MPIAQRGLKRHLASGGKAVNGWCSIPSAVTAEVMARAGYDTVTIDLQHGLIDYQAALAMLQVVDGFNAPTLCRVSWNEPGAIMKALDAGFTGVICPMVNTREQAERLAATCRYAPAGNRSFGPTRAMQVHGADYARNANDFIMAFAMIETAEAVANLDAILEVDGIDGVYIGPADLGLSLGYAPTLLPEASVMDVISAIRTKTLAAGKATGIHCGSPVMVRQMLDDGFGLATLLTDMRLFTNVIATSLAEARDLRASVVKGQY